jgi:hypothetical protein
VPLEGPFQVFEKKHRRERNQVHLSWIGSEHRNAALKYGGPTPPVVATSDSQSLPIKENSEIRIPSQIPPSMSTPITSPAVDAESKVANVIAMVVTTLTIATITTFARLYTRGVVIKKIGVDDWGTIAALVRQYSI